MELFGMGGLPFLGILPLLLWSLAWKGWALWLAARRGEMVWFVVLLVVNTFGLLDIFYIFAVAKRSDTKDIAEKNTRDTSAIHEEKST